MAPDTPQRKYAMTKGLGPGDWLLPSNDASTLFRLSRYEDGPSYGLDPEVFPCDFTAWQVWRWLRNFSEEPPSTLEDLEDWDRWDLLEQGLKSRDAAIQAALKWRHPAPRP